MKGQTAPGVFDRFYREAPQEQKELRRFRATHPLRHLMVDDVTWQYISCGQGQQAILLLPGGTGFGEGFFRYIMAMEAEYRLVSPIYPPVEAMAQLADGLVSILEVESIRQANVLGQSLGGMVAQVLVRRYPPKVTRLILSHTTTTSPPVGQAIVLERQKEIEGFQRLLPFLPLCLLRSVSRWRLFRHLSVMEAEDRGFWKAYLNEMLSSISKEYIIASNRCQLDFFQNYAFSRDDLANWPGKVLILESDSDPHLSPSERRALRRLYPQAQVHTFHGSGHLTLIVNPGEFLSVVRSFLERE